MHQSSEFKIFAGSSSAGFVKLMCDYIGVESGKSEFIKFSDGNLFVKVGETVRDKDVYIVQSIGLKPNDEFTEILFWLDAFKRASANTVTAVIPYFGYAKGDKKDEPRVSIRARVCAECLELAGADRVIIMDLHSPQIQGFFKKPVDNLFAMPLLCEYIKSLKLENYIIVSPDAGYAKQARKFASYLGVSVAIGDKIRKTHDENAEVLEIIGDVKGKNAIIVDDFSISGGTIVNLSKELKKRGVQDIYACLSHLMVSKEGVKKIEESPIKQLISTDSVCNDNIHPSSKIKIISVAPLFAESVVRIDERESLSSLFDSVPDKVLNASIK